MRLDDRGSRRTKKLSLMMAGGLLLLAAAGCGLLEGGSRIFGGGSEDFTDAEPVSVRASLYPDSVRSSLYGEVDAPGLPHSHPHDRGRAWKKPY